MKQQNLKIRIQQLLATLTVGIVLVGCSQNSKEAVPSPIQSSPSTSSSSPSSIGNIEDDSNPTIVPEEETKSSENDFDYFAGAKAEIQDLLESEQIEEAKEKGKEYFITGIDFIFYDKEIKGITFDDLTEEGKKVTLENLEIMDGWIEAVAPDYKDKISEKYAIVKDFISTKYYDAIDAIKESIGEENYSSFQNQKEKLTDKLSDTKDKTLEKISDWYQNFKNNKS